MVPVGVVVGPPIVIECDEWFDYLSFYPASKVVSGCPRPRHGYVPLLHCCNRKTACMSPSPCQALSSEPSLKLIKTSTSYIKGTLYRIWCGVNRLGDSGVKVV